MRIFIAGATGAIGVPLVRRLVADGHAVAGTTRSESKAGTLRALGAEPVVCDVFDAAALTAAVVGFAPDAVIHEPTSRTACATSRRMQPPTTASAARERATCSRPRARPERPASWPRASPGSFQGTATPPG